MNQITIVGYVGRDAELTYTPQGSAVAKFSIADSRKQGDKEQTTWYNISCWNKLAEIAAQFVKKGTQVLVIGVLQPREYTGKDGATHTSMDVMCDKFHLMGKKSDGDSGKHEAVGAAAGEATGEPGFPF